MKSVSLLVLGGLFAAGTALAGEPVQSTTTAAPSMKVGIDKATGKLRPLTAAESAALDAQAPASANAARSSAKAVGQPASAKGIERFPATEAEARATARTVNGITMEKPSREHLSSLTVVRNADGTLSYSENDEMMHSHKVKTAEAASE